MSRITGGFIAPQEESKKSKVRDGLQLPEEGPQQALLIGVVEMGTFSRAFGNEPPKDTKRIMLIFEYPELKQLVYEDDTEPRSFIKYEEMTLSMYEKSNFYKVVDALNNGAVNKSDYGKLDFSELLGKRVFTSISHVTDKTDETKHYANIDSFMKIGKVPQPDNFISDGNRYFFFIDRDSKGTCIGNNFMTENFAELPFFLREKIMKSHEAIYHKARGGSFAEPPRNENSNGETAQQNNTANQKIDDVPAGYKFIDVPGTGFSYKQYKDMGWTNKQLLSQGYLVKDESPAAPPKPPAPESTPAAPPAPSAPPVEDKANDFDPFAEDDDDLPY